MKLKRALATGAAVVIAGFSLTACGDDGGGGGDAGGAPDDATKEEFCKVWNDDTLGGDADSDDADAQADAAHEAADALAEVGTPEGMGEAERNGFEAFLGYLGDVDADDIEKFDEADPTDEDAFADALGIDKDDADDVIAFITYASTECVEV